MQRVLVVDDNAELRSVVSDVLHIEGFAVSEAADGLEAVEAFVKCHPDAVLMDLQMPRSSGLDALISIRIQNRKVPVIIFTGVSDPLVEREARLKGASGYLQKFPLDIELLVRSLREVMTDSRKNSWGERLVE